MKIASIDIGTNAVKSKIFETTPASIRYIDGIRSPIRLGKEVFEDGKLSDKKLKQLTKTLQEKNFVAFTQQQQQQQQQQHLQRSKH